MRRLHYVLLLTVFAAVTCPSALQAVKKSQLDAEDENTLDMSGDAYRILYIGDSITRHGFNKNTIRKLGWGHVSGMAASSESRDYAHRFATMVQEALPQRDISVHFHTFGGSGSVKHRLSALDKVKPVKPHLVVVQLGEHEKRAVGADTLRKNYRELLERLLSWTPEPLVLCTGVWNPGGKGKRKQYGGWTATVEKVMREECERQNVPFVSVEQVALDPEASGTGEHPGVKWHPNDKGMKGYATRLFAAFRQHSPLVTE